MDGKYIEDLIIEDARIFSTNFSGREKVWNGKIINTEGTMNFCVHIPDDIAEAMIADGWAIRISQPREGAEDREPSYFLPVEIKYRDRSRRLLPEKILPHVFMYTGRKETELTEDTIGVLDGADFQLVDLTIHPRIWEDDNGDRKVKAYLIDGRFTIKESRIAAKYANYGKDEED